MNRLYCDFEKYVAVKKAKLMRKLAMLSVGNAHNHYNKLLFNQVFVGETLRHERYHESCSLPSQSLG